MRDRLRRLPHLARRIWATGDIPVLSERPIGWRFYALSALGLMSLLAFAVSYGIGEWRISSAARDQAQFGEMRDRAAGFRADLLALQTGLSAYTDQHEAAAAAQMKTTFERTAATVAKMRTLGVAEGDKETLDAMESGTQALSADFAKVVAAQETLGLTDNDGIRAKLNASIKAIQSELDVWPNQDALTARILQMRLAEKDFILTKEPGRLRLHRRWANEVDLKIDSGGLDPATQGRFHQLLANYLADWTAFGESALALNEASADMQKIEHELQPKTDALFDKAQTASEQANLAEIGIRRTVLWLTMAIGLVAALIFQLAAAVFRRSITIPISDMEHAMRDLAAGRQGVEIPGQGRSDEIGAMAKEVQVFKDNMAAVERMTAERARQSESVAERGRRLDALTAAFDREVAEIMKGVADSMGALRERAEAITTMVGRTSDQMIQVDHSSRQATEGVNSIAAAAEELASQVHDIAARVSESTAVTNEAADAASHTDRLVSGLSEAADRIGEVVALITAIAGKTHMLALNATIESVRAGEAGKGFAVVANEVKALSAQTSAATRNISDHVAAIQSKTAEAVASIGKIVTTTGRIKTNADQIAYAVENQESATHEIARNAGLAADGTSSAAEQISLAARQASDMGQAARVMLGEAQATGERADRLRYTVAAFLAEVSELRG
jgi:methyl-accepting chemotaxis protein